MFDIIPLKSYLLLHLALIIHTNQFGFCMIPSSLVAIPFLGLSDEYTIHSWRGRCLGVVGEGGNVQQCSILCSLIEGHYSAQSKFCLLGLSVFSSRSVLEELQREAPHPKRPKDAMGDSRGTQAIYIFKDQYSSFTLRDPQIPEASLTCNPHAPQLQCLSSPLSPEHKCHHPPRSCPWLFSPSPPLTPSSRWHPCTELL